MIENSCAKREARHAPLRILRGTGGPKGNAQAERINHTMKNELLQGVLAKRIKALALSLKNIYLRHRVKGLLPDHALQLALNSYKNDSATNISDKEP